MGRGVGNKLVNAIVRKIEARQAEPAGAAKAAYEKQGATTRVAPVTRAAAANPTRDGGTAGGGNPPGSGKSGKRQRSAGGMPGASENPYANVRIHVETGR
jgi:hypothetical protein